MNIPPTSLLQYLDQSPSNPRLLIDPEMALQQNCVQTLGRACGVNIKKNLNEACDLAI
jgi:hypothetical protein